MIDEAYETLGLPPGASEREVKAAWRRLAAEWHPDRNPSPHAVARMQRLNEAIEAIRRAGFAAPSARDDAAATAAAPAAPDAPRGARPLRRRVRLTLEEAALGCTRTLRGRLVGACVPCHGSGWQLVGGACAGCHGRGALSRGGWFGWLGVAEECPDCGGHGIARRRCPDCEGRGKAAPRAWRCSARIPAGARDGDRLRVPARAGAPELELEVVVEPHPFFRAEADGTLRCELPVDGFAWLAGRWIEVPTPGGLQQMRLDRAHLNYRLRGQGLPTAGGGRGDLLVRVAPAFPAHEDPAREALFEQLLALNASAAEDPGLTPLRGWQRALRAWSARRRPAGAA